MAEKLRIWDIMFVNVTFETGYYDFIFYSKIFLVLKLNLVTQERRKMGNGKIKCLLFFSLKIFS